MALGAPNLFFGVAAGNMDSMINPYTTKPLTLIIPMQTVMQPLP